MRSGDKDGFLRTAQRDLPIGAILLFIHKVDEIDIVAAHHFQQAIGRGGADDDIDPGELPVESGNEPPDHRGAQGFHGAEPQGALRLRGGANGIPGALRGLDDLPGLLQESLSGGGKIDRTADALKQRNAEFDFQLTDLHGDGRLGIA